MNRRDAHLDAVLRHLGAAYYDSSHGKAAQADVAAPSIPWPGKSARNPLSSRRPPATTAPRPASIATASGTAECGMS